MGCEDIFSRMKRVKIYFRNSLLYSKLSSINVIFIEKSEAKLLGIEEIINLFSDGHNNRRIILKLSYLYCNLYYKL